MFQRDHDCSTAPGQTRSHTALPRRSAGPVLALQRAIGDRRTTQVLARRGRRDKTERWKATGFDAVNIQRTAIGKTRP